MDTLNRALWIIIGALLLVAGGLIVAASAGWLPGANTDSPLLWNALIEQWRDWEPWVWVGVALVGAIVAWLGWRLIRAQLRRDDRPRMRDLAIDAPDGRGRAVVGRSALAQATQQELEHIRGVRGAAVRLLGEHADPEVRARLDLMADASLPAVAADVREVMGRFATTSGLRAETVDVTIRVDGGAAARVS